MKHYVIAGSGIVGCVIARKLADKGNKVTIYERRSHAGGNLYDCVDEHGIRVHLYGPHIFHTNSQRVYDLVNSFCELQEYNLVCGSVMDGKCVPTAFDFTSVDTFFPDEAETIKEHIRLVFGDRESATVLEMLDSEDEYVKKFADFLYEKDYRPYTAKQWGIEPEKIDKQIFKRVPILFSYGSRYFGDKYQAMPVNGYMELVNNLLDHENISLQLGTDCLEHVELRDDALYLDGERMKGTLIYTGPLDEFFGCRHGRLPYRSLRFEWQYSTRDSFQDMPVVAYPQAEGYTRITEYKKLPAQHVQGTTYAVEYPLPYRAGEQHEPYYPVMTEESCALYEKYAAEAKKIGGLVCCGRLAEFKYYNIDQAIERALETADALLQENTPDSTESTNG